MTPVPGTAGGKIVTDNLVTVGAGNNTWAGGSNASAFSVALFLPGSTLEVDGQPLVKDGKVMQKPSSIEQRRRPARLP